MTFETLIARRQGPVLELTLNRPESRNAMSLAMVASCSRRWRRPNRPSGRPTRCA
jgi:enoyl-CoA hydratase/carnithine racemase